MRFSRVFFFSLFFFSSFSSALGVGVSNFLVHFGFVILVFFFPFLFFFFCVFDTRALPYLVNRFANCNASNL